jgi:hypothetical protein
MMRRLLRRVGFLRPLSNRAIVFLIPYMVDLGLLRQQEQGHGVVHRFSTGTVEGEFLT